MSFTGTIGDTETNIIDSFQDTDSDIKKELVINTMTYWDKFNKEFGHSYPYPLLGFDLKGVASGIACYKENCIKYNLDIYRDNREAFLKRTVPHEIAHLFAYRMYSLPYGRPIKPHGKEWQKVMRDMGLNPSRCHSYIVTKAREVKREYLYRCKCREYPLTVILHKRIMKGGYRECIDCKQRIIFVGKVGEIPVNREEANNKIEELKRKLEMLG